MYLAYSLLLTFGLLVFIPYFLFQALAHGKYIDGLRQRLGAISQNKTDARPVIWLHCVSVGETQAARPLVERLVVDFPQYCLVVSTITMTGQALASQVFASKVERVFYFPFDWSWTVRRALKAIRPEIVLIMETELWPNFLRECSSRGIPVALVNGRISRQSFRRYRLISFFISSVLAKLSLAIMQSENDADRIAALGFPKENLAIAGNLKFDVESVSPNAQTTASIQQRFGLDQGIPLILAASTHTPEEKIVIESFQQLKQTRAVRLMIAPRRPERFQEVAKLLEESGLSWARKTAAPLTADSSTEVILLDTIGELPAVYSLATVVFVGGSIVDRGGHNVLEPAANGACVITGHNTHNFQAIVQLLNEADAIVQLPPLEFTRAAQCLTHELESLLTNEDRRAQLAARAKDIIEKNRGAAERTAEIIKPLLRQTAGESLATAESLAEPGS